MKEYKRKDVIADLIALQRIGLIEVIGINDKGEELWGTTEFGKSLTPEQAAEIIDKSL